MGEVVLGSYLSLLIFDPRELFEVLADGTNHLQQWQTNRLVE
jgi:hypothetical protein